MKELNLATTRKHYYGAKAWGYDLGNETSEKWLNEQIAIEQGLVGRSGIVLDIPCGTGRYFEIYRRLGLDFIGMDVSEDMMVQARAKDGKAHINYGDIMNIPLSDNRADYTVCTRLLNFFTEDEMKSAVDELCRVTKSLVLVGLFYAKRAERRNRCNVHSLSPFYDAVHTAGFIVSDEYEIRHPDYKVFHCVPPAWVG